MATFDIDRLEKRNNREGIPEIFIQITVHDDLGSYTYAKWLSEPDCDEFLDDFDEIDQNFKTLREFKAVKGKAKSFLTKGPGSKPRHMEIIEKYLSRARKNYEDSIIEANVSLAERLKAAKT